MKTAKRIFSYLLCLCMVLSTFAGINYVEKLEPVADAAYVSTKIDVITQEQVVGTQTSIDGILARDFWYGVYAGDYFDGHSEPTNMVIPGLGSSSNYTPQGMTYWPEKNWILMSAYDDSVNEQNRPTCIYAIDVATGKFVALFYIYNADGTKNTSHGGGIAVSDNNLYFADSGSNISYIPLSELDKAEGSAYNVTLKGSVNLSGEMGGAKTSYCCYDDGVLWVGNFYYSKDSSYSTAANSAHNSMLLGYKLEGDTSEEEWDYLCGQYKNLITLNNSAQSVTATGSNGGASLSVEAYQNGDSIDVIGTVTGSANGGSVYTKIGTVTFPSDNYYTLEFVSTSPDAELWLSSFAASDFGETVTQLDDGRYYHCLKIAIDGTWDVQVGQRNVNGNCSINMTDLRISRENENLLNLSHTSKNADGFNYNITWQTNDTYVISGTATNTTSAETEMTSKYATLDLVEGQTYTLSFRSDNQFTDAYIFAPAGANGTHMRLCAQRGTKLDDGTYLYTSTFTAGKNLVSSTGGDYTWPVQQSTNGGFTGRYTIRFDQDNIPAGETRNIWIGDLRVQKADTRKNTDRIHYAGTAGNPTYVIAIDNAYDRIQYAMVDNGKVYLSRSWNRNMSDNTYISELDIFDIDLNVLGTYSLTINGATRNDCYKATGAHAFHSLSMMEALCVVDDYLYFFTESAAYYYRQYDWDQADDNKSDSTASQPVDVVWKVDQYAIMGEERVGESVGGEACETWEKVDSLDEINYTDEYMIVYESEVKDPATGQKIMYALDSQGGFKDGLVPKNSAGTQDNTGDSLGIVGHPISRYVVEEGIMTLYTPSADDIPSVRWKIIGADTGSMRLESQDSYYGLYKNLYIGSRLMYMAPSSSTKRLDHVSIEDCGDGTFKFFYKGDANYYLWCNDGTNQAYMDAYTEAYNSSYAFTAPVKAYAGQLELAGTFHSDASGNKTGVDTGNLTGEAVNEEYQKMTIYRRANDISSASGNSGLYTDLSAELQSDGTYTLTLESYTTGQTVTKTASDGEPIDFVFVLDTSSSMLESDVSYWGKSDSPEAYDYSWANDSNGSRYLKYGNSYYATWGKHYDKNWVNYYAVNTYSSAKNEDYYFAINSELRPKGSSSNTDMTVAYGFGGTSRQDRSFAGGYYWVNRTGDVDRLTSMKASTLELIQQIADHAEKTGIQHRIAIIQYGSDYNTDEANTYKCTGMYSTATGVTMTNYTELDGDVGFGQGNSVYTNAFFPATHDNLQTIVNNISVSGDCDTYVNHGFDMALNTIADQMEQFSSGHGDRIYGQYEGTADAHTKEANASACIVHITDGAPGVGGNDSTTATTVANEAIGNAKVLKDYDVNIYSIKLGNPTMSGFEVDDYLNALSSNYPSATSVTSLGTASSSTTSYYIQASLTADQSTSGYNNIFNGLLEGMDGEILDTGTTIALNGNSVLQENLSEYFNLNSASATVKTADIYYDALGRISEDAPVASSSYSATINKTNNTVQVTGFDYSSEYVADGNEGKKLFLEIKGVQLADKGEVSVPVNIESSTAIFQTSSDITNNNPFQGFPQANVDIPQLNYVVDYGVDMKTSNLVGTPLSIDTASDKQSPYTTDLLSTQGVKISSNSLNINISPSITDVKSTYTLIQRPLGGYYWAKVNVVPASNVYFEENEMTVSNTTGTAWSTVSGGSAVTQETSTLAGDVYGYDSNYNGANGTYSNGSAYSVKTSQSSNRSQTISFKYKGTGFDLVSATGQNMGTIMAVVKDSANKIEKLYIIDNYYSGDTLTQVPVIKHENASFGTYTVEVTAAYLNRPNTDQSSVDGVEPTQDELIAAMLTEAGLGEYIGENIELVWADENSILNGGTGSAPAEDGNTVELAATEYINIVDGFRIYNPLNGNSDYYNETDAKYINVIDSLISGDLTSSTALSGILFVENDLTDADGNKIDIAFGNYQKVGPEKELYLNPGKSIAFNVTLPSADSRVMVSMRSVTSGAAITVNGGTASISSATEMYYDLTDIVSKNGTQATVTITNSGSGILAINNIKLVNKAALAQVDVTEASLLAISEILDQPATLVELNKKEINLSLPGSPAHPNKNADPGLDPVGEYIITYPDTTVDAPSDEEINEFVAFLSSVLKGFWAIIVAIISYLWRV